MNDYSKIDQNTNISATHKAPSIYAYQRWEEDLSSVNCSCGCTRARGGGKVACSYTCCSIETCPKSTSSSNPLQKSTAVRSLLVFRPMNKHLPSTYPDPTSRLASSAAVCTFYFTGTNAGKGSSRAGPVHHQMVPSGPCTRPWGYYVDGRRSVQLTSASDIDPSAVCPRDVLARALRASRVVRGASGTWKACVAATIPKTVAPVIFILRNLVRF